MATAEQETETDDVHKIEQYFFDYLTGKRDEDWAIAFIADVKIRGQELRNIFNSVYDGMERTDPREERARRIRRRLDQNGL